MGIDAMVRGLVRGAGLRFLGRRKAAAAMAVATLALALGANTAVFSVVKAFLLSGMGLPDPGGTVQIAPVRELPGRGDVVFAEAYPNYELLRSTQRSFVDVSTHVQNVSSWDDGSETRPIQAARVTASFFATTGVSPFLGRAFDPEDEGPSPAPVVLVGHALWAGAMGGDPGVLGRTMVLNGEPHTVVGVMPPGFTHPLPTEIWLPFDLPERARTSVTGARTLGVLGRVRADVPLSTARAEMDALTRRALEASSDNRGYRYELRTFTEVILPGARRTLLLIQVGAGVLTLLAVVNLASLLVAWGHDRRQEMSVRVALGASDARVMGYLVAQAAVLVGVGSVLGVGLAAVGLPAVRRLPLGPFVRPFLDAIALDTPVLVASAAATALAALAAGLLPALLSRKGALADGLRATRGASASRTALRWQKGMVLAQAVPTVLILSTSAMLGLSFRNVSRVPDGFDPADRVVARIQLPGTAYQTQAARADFGQRFLSALREEPALGHLGFASTLPVGDVPWGARFRVEQGGAEATEEPLLLHYRRIGAGYFAAIGIPLLEGRDFDDGDDATRAPVAIVSRAAAARLWPDEPPLGRRLYRAVPGTEDVELEIVGVVGDVMDGGYVAPPGDAVYVPWAQTSVGRMSVVAVARSSPEAAVAAIRRALRATDPSVAAADVATLEELVQGANTLPRLQAVLLALFSVVATGIAGVGSFGLMSQLVGAREREFAIRLTLGARPGGVGVSVLGQAAAIVGPGVVMGVVLAVASGSVLRSFLFGVEPGSVPIVGGVALGTLALAALTSVPSAVRAMRVPVARVVSRS